jgi:hypothetical protein
MYLVAGTWAEARVRQMSAYVREPLLDVGAEVVERVVEASSPAFVRSAE